MDIRALVRSSDDGYAATVSTNGRDSSLAIAPKSGNTGSSVNGGELLCLALATCYCNDIYREAAARGVVLTRVSVDVTSEFGGVGEPAHRITYTPPVESDAPDDEIAALIRHTDSVAEVHNTLRRGIAVELTGVA